MTLRQVFGWLVAIDRLDRERHRAALAIQSAAARGDKAALERMHRDLSD